MVIFKRSPFQVQRRPWRKVGVWLGHKLFDPEAKKPLPKKPPPPYLHLGTLAEIALRPLTVVMEPFVPGAYYQKNVFERVLQRALWSPVAKQNFLAVGIPAASPANWKTPILPGFFLSLHSTA